MVGEFKRYSREKQFFNRESEENARARVDEYARVLRCAQRFYEDLVMSYSRGRHVLEYGCGEGEWACRIAENGASSVTAFDLSEARVEIAQEKARNRHLDNVHFLVANAEALDFEDDAFDFICGTAILHHLDLHKALSEMSRVLRPRGAAVFMEPLGHNPLINLYRRLTPHLRTEDEHPLVVDDCKIARPFFEVDVHCFGLLSLLAIPFRKTSYFARLTKALDAADRFLFEHVPRLKRYAWYCVVVLTPKPS